MRPRYSAGESSETYIGETTEAPPTPTPPTNRKSTNAHQLVASALPTALTKKSSASTKSMGRRP